jgi:hypothetical protein
VRDGGLAARGDRAGVADLTISPRASRWLSLSVDPMEQLLRGPRAQTLLGELTRGRGN